MSLGIVTEHLIRLIDKQINDNGLVVWYDPDGGYESAIAVLELPDTTILRYTDSFLRLRWEVDQKHLMDGKEAPRLLIYVPMAQEQTHHALIELETAGVIMQPGQQPPARNTRLAVVARNALKCVLGDENAAFVEKQTEAGKLTLADLDAIAEKGGEISKGLLALIFGTGNPQEIALHFLNNDRFDEIITQKDAKSELEELLRYEFSFDIPDNLDLKNIRQNLARHILMTDFITGLGSFIPSSLTSIPIASRTSGALACVALAEAWRLRRDGRESYMATALRVEQEFTLAPMVFDPEVMVNIETFPFIERALLRYAENRLLEKIDADMLTLAESRLSRFWCDAVPTLQARWALVASAAEVLLETDRVEREQKKAPASSTGIIKEYAEGPKPWCLMDTHHRHMENRWYNFEPLGDDHDSIEKLIIRARRRYVAVGSEISKVFLRQLQKNVPDKSVARQREVFENHVKPFLGEKKIGYIWVDSLRFEMGRELARLLREHFAVNIQPALAAVPTVTEIGMAALLPGAHGNVTVVGAGSGKLALEINGTTVKDRKDRLMFLRKHVDVAVFDTKLDNLLPKPAKKVCEGIENAQLILVTSQEIDEICEQDNIPQARRQMDGILNDLRRGIRMLVEMGVEHIVLTADHGHLFADELGEDMKIDPPGGETVDLHRRVWVGHGGNADDAFLRVPLSSLDMQSEFDLATPWTFACFKSKGGAKAYFHGGLSLQELLVPVITLCPSSSLFSGPPVGIRWTIVPGSQKLTTRFFSVQITGVKSGMFEIAPPKVRVELRAKGKIVSRAVSASYGFEEATGDVALRIDGSDSKRIAPNTVTLMITEETDQKSVGVYLFDVVTGVELSRLEKIEVTISM
jgi:hypothetical protein